MKDQRERDPDEPKPAARPPKTPQTPNPFGPGTRKEPDFDVERRNTPPKR